MLTTNIKMCSIEKIDHVDKQLLAAALGTATHEIR
jgi:hypothetical protein